MTKGHLLASDGFLWALVRSLLVATIVACVGYFPTKRLGGEDAVPAMLAGCSVSVVSSVAGTIPLAIATGGSSLPIPQAILMATGIRFVAVLFLALSVALSGWFDKTPLLIWVAVSYLFLLLVDTLQAVRLCTSVRDTES